MDSEDRKITTLIHFRDDRGFDYDVAARVTLAMMPLDDWSQPNPTFENAARKLASEFANAVSNADAAEADQLATDTLRELRSLAAEHEPAYLQEAGVGYTKRYDDALAGRLTELRFASGLCPECYSRKSNEWHEECRRRWDEVRALG